MKIYVAGIILDTEMNNLSSKEKSLKLTQLFPKVIAAAKKCYGQDVITIIVLCEYSLNADLVKQEPRAVTFAEKEEILTILRQSMQSFKNLILIPGSFAACQNLALSPTKVNKMIKNYVALNKFSFLSQDRQFKNEYNNFLNRISLPMQENVYFEHSAYILTDQMITKHKKNFPSQEASALDVAQRKNSIFYAGADDTLRTVMLEKEIIDINLLMCKEHFYNDARMHSKPKLVLPLIEVIISASIDINESKLYGALNIHMDYDTGLTIYLNTMHPQAHLITAVRSIEVLKKINVNDDIIREAQLFSFENNEVGTQLFKSDLSYIVN